MTAEAGSVPRMDVLASPAAAAAVAGCSEAVCDKSSPGGEDNVVSSSSDLHPGLLLPKTSQDSDEQSKLNRRRTVFYVF